MDAVIRTRRLELIPMDRRMAESLVHTGHPEGRRGASGYPTDGTLVVAGMVVTALSEGREDGPFTHFQIVRRSDGAAVGDCGFHAPPDSEGVVTVGYGIAESCRGRGYATEALEALLAFAFLQHGVRQVAADTAAENHASRRTLEKAGMRLVGLRDGVAYYQA